MGVQIFRPWLCAAALGQLELERSIADLVLLKLWKWNVGLQAKYLRAPEPVNPDGLHGRSNVHREN